MSELVVIKRGRHAGRIGKLVTSVGDRRKVEVGQHGLILDLNFRNIAPATEGAVASRLRT